MKTLNIGTYAVCFFFIITFYSEGLCQTSAVANTVTIFIHGDGDYLFHSKNGESLLADEVVLNKAINTAEKLINSEVFIFHQKKKEFSFLFFPVNDLDLYFFKDGVLKNKTSAQRTNFDLKDEINFYQSYSAKGAQNILLYYGHEIPLNGGYGYNSSYKNEPFNLIIFESALKNLSGGKKFDLVVLSTCNNGTPEVINKLAPLTKYVIASPENLHLSYMNPRHLKKLNYYKDHNFENFVVDFAGSTFNELKRYVETVCAISGYKTDELSSTFMKVADKNMDFNNSPENENCDCSEINNFSGDKTSRGVIVFYNPPVFGKNKYKLEHSGWGCKKNSGSASFMDRKTGEWQSSLRPFNLHQDNTIRD